MMRSLRFRIQVQGAIRREQLEGRNCLVVPVVPMVPGVHSGNRGPVRYTAELLSTFPEAWNNFPVVIVHPTEDGTTNGEPTSANQPRILNRQGVGRLFNVHWDEGAQKLRAEAWLDEERLRQLNPRLLNRILQGSPVEVSTGLLTSDDGVSGVENGEAYQSTITGYWPDHLALLPDDIGACSFDDGCGIRANAKGEKGMNLKKLFEKLGQPARVSPAITNAETEPSIFQTFAATFGGAKADLIMAYMMASHEDIRRGLQKVIDAYDGNGWVHMVLATYDDFVIFEAWGSDPATGARMQTKCYQQSYSRDENDAITLLGQAVEVRQEVSWIPVGSGAEPDQPAEEATMNRQTAIERLTNAEGPFKGKAKAFEGMDDAQVVHLAEKLCPCATANAGTPAAPVVVNNNAGAAQPAVAPQQSTPAAIAAASSFQAALGSIAPEVPASVTTQAAKPQTPEQYVEAAPPEIREVLNTGLRIQKEQRKRLVDAIIANGSNQFSQAELDAMSMETLGKIAAVSIPKPDFSLNSGGERTDNTRRVPDPPSSKELFPQKAS